MMKLVKKYWAEKNKKEVETTFYSPVHTPTHWIIPEKRVVTADETNGSYRFLEDIERQKYLDAIRPREIREYIDRLFGD